MTEINESKIKQLLSFMTKVQLENLFIGFFDPISSGKDQLILALKNQDTDSVHKQAHFIIGSSSFLGMQGIHDYCAHIENELNTNQFPDYTKLLGEFESIWITSKNHAEVILKNMPG
jgi:HPt (histidine-containing phosphotransfer) domain-containing protein